MSNKYTTMVIIGDLNEIKFLHEKEGGNPRPQQYMVAFQQAIDDCNLHDMGFVGDIFTWRRGRIRGRLDRGLVNDGWSSLFPNANLEHCNFNHSDHRPLLVDTDFYQGTTPIQEGPKRFEARWLREANFSDLVQEMWDKAGGDPNVSGIFQQLSRMHSEFH